MREWARGIDGRNGRSSSSEQVSVSQYPCMILLSVSRNVTRHHSFLNLHTTTQTREKLQSIPCPYTPSNHLNMFGG